MPTQTGTCDECGRDDALFFDKVLGYTICTGCGKVQNRVVSPLKVGVDGCQWMKSRMDDGPRNGQWYVCDRDGGRVLCWCETEWAVDYVMEHLRGHNVPLSGVESAAERKG